MAGNQQTRGNDEHDASYYAKCMFGGVLSCGLTHTMVTPLDVTKCRMQTNSKQYTGLLSGMSLIRRQEGFAGLVKGWKPTLVGYSLQGLGKFGLYEYFKDLYGGILGPEMSNHYKGTMWLAASASAEVFADVMLCPWEMVKVKVQTAPASENWPNGLLAAVGRMNANKKDTRFPVRLHLFALSRFTIDHGWINTVLFLCWWSAYPMHSSLPFKCTASGISSCLHLYANSNTSLVRELEAALEPSGSLHHGQILLLREGREHVLHPHIH